MTHTMCFVCEASEDNKFLNPAPSHLMTHALSTKLQFSGVRISKYGLSVVFGSTDSKQTVISHKANVCS